MFIESLSLPTCLIKHIYDYIPSHYLYNLSKSYFNRYVDNYYIYHKCTNNNRFFHNKLNNSYIRYLIRNNMYIFISHLTSSYNYIKWNSKKRYRYNNHTFKTYLDYCIYLSNEYGSERTKQLFASRLNGKSTSKSSSTRKKSKNK